MSLIGVFLVNGITTNGNSLGVMLLNQLLFLSFWVAFLASMINLLKLKNIALKLSYIAASLSVVYNVYNLIINKGSGIDFTTIVMSVVIIVVAIFLTMQKKYLV